MKPLLLAVAVLACTAATPAAAQELKAFYCFAPDAASGVTYASQALPVGPVAERANYGSAFVAWLKEAGLLPKESAAKGLCVMRATEAEIAEAQAKLATDCWACGTATTTIRPVQWMRSTPKQAADAKAAQKLAELNAQLAALRKPGGGESKPASSGGNPAPAPPPHAARSQTPPPPIPAGPTGPPGPERQALACAVLYYTAIMDRPLLDISQPEVVVTLDPGVQRAELRAEGGTIYLGAGAARVKPGRYVLALTGTTWKGGSPQDAKRQVRACVSYKTQY